MTYDDHKQACIEDGMCYFCYIVRSDDCLLCGGTGLLEDDDD